MQAIYTVFNIKMKVKIECVLTDCVLMLGARVMLEKVGVRNNNEFDVRWHCNLT